METEVRIIPKSGHQDTAPEAVVGEINETEQQNPHESKKRVKHEDHHVSRKYKLFSNHSSYGDSPHTHTSF